MLILHPERRPQVVVPANPLLCLALPTCVIPQIALRIRLLGSGRTDKGAAIERVVLAGLLRHLVLLHGRGLRVGVAHAEIEGALAVVLRIRGGRVACGGLGYEGSHAEGHYGVALADDHVLLLHVSPRARPLEVARTDELRAIALLGRRAARA